MTKNTRSHRYVRSKTLQSAFRFNIRKMIDDLGGIRSVSLQAGVHRTTIHRWIKQDHISTGVLELLLTVWPNLPLQGYFERIDAEVSDNEPANQLD